MSRTRVLFPALLTVAMAFPSIALAVDADGDGYDHTIDCDDRDPTVHPGAVELCDSLDNDCDGLVDEGCGSTGGEVDCADGIDNDGDGYIDCLDSDCFLDPACMAPGETDCTDGRDNDGDGLIDCADRDCAHDPACSGTGTDADGDGFDNTVDCDDRDPSVYPGAAELCDSLDNDCDGLVDEGCGATGETDCTDGRDNDGDGDVDCADRDCTHDPACSTTSADADGDGFDDAAYGGTDCDDTDPRVHPGATETCDGLDNNCNGVVDEGCTTPTDADRDGFDDTEDCDDGDASVYPGADEYCDGVDNDCDAQVDEDDAVDATAWYTDNDADTFGSDMGPARLACEQPTGWVANNTDCDDDDPQINPDAAELEDGLDNDCDDEVDEDFPTDTGDPATVDADADGYDDSVDCDDNDASIHPDADEVCDDGIDNDCDDEVDEDCSEPTDSDEPSDSDTPSDTGEPGDESKDCSSANSPAVLLLTLPLALLGLARRRRS